MPANAGAANTGSLTYEEIEKFVAEWFRKLDLHVPADQLLPLVADSNLEMRFPERQVNGLEEFRDWYAGDPAGERSMGVIHLFFDEVHTVDRLAVSWRDERALVDIVVNWQARRWRAPAARSEWVGFIAYQHWEMIRSVSTGCPVISRYVVNELRPLPGSQPL